MQSKRYSFKNQFNSFTSVFVYVGQNKDNFTVEVTVRKKNEDGTENIKVNAKTYPNSFYNDFIKDLEQRLN